MTGTLSPRQFLDAMEVDVPEGQYQGMRVKRFVVRGDERGHLEHMIEGRSARPGSPYTKLSELVPGAGPEGGPLWRCWMSDTFAERQDHLPVLRQAQELGARTMLVNGLGLGMVVRAALLIPTIERIDVVEIDRRVIKLAGPTYTADPRVRIHRADAWKQAVRWPGDVTWDVAWHDCWASGDRRHAERVTALLSSYADRVRWQGAWAYESIMGTKDSSFEDFFARFLGMET